MKPIEAYEFFQTINKTWYSYQDLINIYNRAIAKEITSLDWMPPPENPMNPLTTTNFEYLANILFNRGLIA